MELMFSKLTSLETENNSSSRHSSRGGGVGGSAGEETTGGGEEEEEEEVLNLEPVAVQRFEASLSGGHWGLHAYVPVTFSGVHFVRVDCMVGFYCCVIMRVLLLAKIRSERPCCHLFCGRVLWGCLSFDPARSLCKCRMDEEKRKGLLLTIHAECTRPARCPFVSH